MGFFVLFCFYKLWFLNTNVIGTKMVDNVCEGLPGWPSGQCRRHKRFGFNPWVGMIPWRRKWQPTPLFLPGQRGLEGYSPWRLKRVRPEWAQGECVFIAFRLLPKKSWNYLVNISSFCSSPHSLPFLGLTREIWLISVKRTWKMQVRI